MDLTTTPESAIIRGGELCLQFAKLVAVSQDAAVVGATALEPVVSVTKRRHGFIVGVLADGTLRGSLPHVELRVLDPGEGPTGKSPLRERPSSIGGGFLLTAVSVFYRVPARP